MSKNTQKQCCHLFYVQGVRSKYSICFYEQKEYANGGLLHNNSLACIYSTVKKYKIKGTHFIGILYVRRHKIKHLVE